MKFLKRHGGVRAYNARETRVSFTVPFPDLLLVPLINQGEELQEEDSQVITLPSSAAMNTWQNALQDFCNGLEHVKVGHAKEGKRFQKVEAVEGIRDLEHQPRVDAVLDKDCAEVEHLFLVNILKDFLQLSLEEFFGEFDVHFVLFVLLLEVCEILSLLVSFLVTRSFPRRLTLCSR